MSSSKKQKSWWRRRWRAVLAIGSLVGIAAIMTTALLLQKTPQPTAATPPMPPPQNTTTAPGPTTQPTTTTTTTVDQPPNNGNASSQSPKIAAVQAAFNAESVLVQALFQDPDTLQAQVDAIAVPSQRQALGQGLIAAAAITARHLGHYTVEEALHSSYSSVLKKAWKIRSFDGHKAAITLYVETYVVDSVGQWYLRPGKIIIDLRKIENRWLYYGNEDVPAGEKPANIDGYSTKEIEDLYKPYLRGFTTYAP